MKAEIHREKVILLVGVGLILLVATGCITRVQSARTINEKLAYVPWQQLQPRTVALVQTEAGKSPSPVREGRLRSSGINAAGTVVAPGSTDKGPPLAKVKRQRTPDTSGQQLQLVPGMQITFFSFPGTDPQSGPYQAVPGLAEYQWLVPGETLGAGDYFFLSYIFTSGRLPYLGNLPSCSGNCIDPMAEFNKLPTQPSDCSKEPRTKPCVAEQVLHSLGLSVLHVDPLQSESWTAAIVREWMTKVAGKDFDQPTTCEEPWQVVSAHVPFGLPDANGPTDVELRLYDWNTAASNDDPFPACDDYGSNQWYQGNYSPVFRERGYVTIDIPIRVRSDTKDREVPVYWSYQDLEDSLSDYRTGVSDFRVRGFRRNLQYLPTVSSPAEFSGSAKYFTVWFSQTIGHHHGAHRIFQAHAGMKKDLLVAPGDIVYISRRHHVERESQVAP